MQKHFHSSVCFDWQPTVFSLDMANVVSFWYLEINRPVICCNSPPDASWCNVKTNIRRCILQTIAVSQSIPSVREVSYNLIMWVRPRRFGRRRFRSYYYKSFILSLIRWCGRLLNLPILLHLFRPPIEIWNWYDICNDQLFLPPFMVVKRLKLVSALEKVE